MQPFNTKLFFSLLNSICTSLPKRSVKTFLELLIGSIISSSGHITQAYLAGNFQCHWTTYYKWLSTGSWSCTALVEKYISIITNFLFKKGVSELLISLDDTCVYRSSEEAPNAKYDYEHSKKKNRSKYVLAQTWVTAAITFFTKENKPIAIPAVSKLAEKKGNKTKIELALELLETISYAVNAPFDKVVLVDAWFMKKTFIIPALELDYKVIGQARIDTVLYFDPTDNKKGPGRKKKYGEFVTKDDAMKFASTTRNVFIYGKENKVRFRSRLIRVKFLNGLMTRAVWCEIYNKKNNSWSKPSLILSTDITLSALEVIVKYSCRWPIESFFNEIKNSWGMKEAWQKRVETLTRWFHINCIGYGLIAIANIYTTSSMKKIFDYFPWRKKSEVTAGMIRQYLSFYLSHLSIRGLWDDKANKLNDPESKLNSDMKRKAS